MAEKKAEKATAGKESKAFSAKRAARGKADNVFSIKGRGIVVVGVILSGTLRTGDKVTLCRTDGSTRTVTVGGIEKYKQGLVLSAAQGENVGILLKEINKEDVSKGDCLIA